jgi:nickel-dependent lactate racemase
MLDITMTPEREITGVFAGNPVEAHAAGVAFMRRTSVYPMPARADVAITSAAGYPLDLTFYQTAKGITAAEHVIKPGGRILLLGECSEGIGSPEYAEKVRTYAGPQEYLDSIANTPVIPDQWQLEKIALVGLRNDLYFYTPGVSADDLGAFAERYFTDVNEAVTAVLDDLPPDARIVLIPEGPYSFARVTA